MPQRATILTKRNRTLALADEGDWLVAASPMSCGPVMVFAAPHLAELVAECLGEDESITITPVMIDDDGIMTFPPEPQDRHGWLAEFAEVHPED